MVFIIAINCESWEFQESRKASVFSYSQPKIISSYIEGTTKTFESSCLGSHDKKFSYCT
jgi:hypothetical protein